MYTQTLEVPYLELERVTMTCHDYELNMITVPCKLTQKAVILSCIILRGTTNALMFNEPLELSKSNPEWDAIRGRFVRTHLLHFFNIFIVHVESFNLCMAIRE